ncbi:MAG: hypothetical protein H0W67_00305 [Gemmatimonadales bacterium]|nr:hypothetical protein [Gemmatimonadales bacterium]
MTDAQQPIAAGSAPATGIRPFWIVALIFGMPLVLGVFHLFFLGIVAVRSDYAWAEMDWNGDGRTTVREALATADVIERPYAAGRQDCVELLWARTGKRIRIECPTTGGTAAQPSALVDRAR